MRGLLKLNNKSKYIYSNANRKLVIEQIGNRITQCIYDTAGRLIEQRIYFDGDSNYNYTKNTYDCANNIVRIQQGVMSGEEDNISYVVNYEYDSMNRIIDEYRPIDSKRSGHVHNSYDNNGNLCEIKEYIDNTGEKYILSVFIYDFNKNVIEEKKSIIGYSSLKKVGKQEPYYKTYVFDYEGNLLKEAIHNEKNEDVTTYSYDYQNRVCSKEEPFSSSGETKKSYFEYDKKGNLKKETITRTVDGREQSCSTIYTYDGLGNLTEKTNASGYTSRYIYDSNSNCIKEIDARYYNQSIDLAPGFIYEYDALNQRIKTSIFDGKDETVVSFEEYDCRGNVVKSVNGEGYNSENPKTSIGSIFEYDACDRVIKTISAQKITTECSYDGSGHILTQKDGRGNTITFEYFTNGKLKSKIYPDGICESYDYDLSGKVETIAKDRAGNSIITYLNVFEKPYKVEYPDGTYLEYQYNSKGDMIQSIDQAGNSKYFEYDPSGNLISEKDYIDTDQNYVNYKLTTNTYDKSNSIISIETWELKQPISGGKSIKNSMRDTVHYTYDKLGRVVRISGPNGRETTYSYDQVGNVVLKEEKVTEDQYNATEYSYDFLSRMISSSILVDTSDLDMNLIGEASTGEGKYASRIKATTINTYDRTGNIISKKDANGNLTRYEYDLDGRMTKKVDPLGNSTTYSYDPNGNIKEEKNARGVSTFYEYDSVNRLIRKRVPSTNIDAVTRYIYDNMGNLIKEISPNNYKVEKDTEKLADSMTGISYTYDVMNRRIASISAEGNIIQIIRYDKIGNTEKVVDGLRYKGNIESSQGTVYSYDALGRVTKKVDPLGNQSSYEYSVLGHIIGQTDSRGNTTKYEYNSDGTLAKIINPDGGVISYEYDFVGRKTKEKNQRENETTYEYNAFGSLRYAKDAYKKQVEYKYDLNGNLVIQKDKNGSSSVFLYDVCNRLIEKRIPLSKDSSGNVIYAREKNYYDNVGNLVSQIHTGTQDKTSIRTTNYTYDESNRVSTITNDMGAKSVHSYDLNGNLVKKESMREKGVDNKAIYDTEEFEYDDMNRLIRSVKLVDQDTMQGYKKSSDYEKHTDNSDSKKLKLITTYEYDVLGNKTQEISASGNVISFAYDVMNRLQTITKNVNNKPVKVSYTYDSVGNKIVETNELGNKTQYIYDELNRVIGCIDAKGYKFTRKYDLTGNIISETNALNSTITYTYDKLNRLETTTDPFGVLINKCEYDANGNMIKTYDAKGNSQLFEYDLNGRLVKTTSCEGNEMKYEYNQYGEKVKTIDGLGSTTAYEYDSEGRLTKVIDANGAKTSYRYDLLGNKLYMIDGRGKTTSYVYGSFGMLRAVKNADGEIKQYQYDLEGNVAIVTDSNGYHTHYIYDNRKLLLKKYVEETEDSITYTYDEVGNRIGMSDVSGETTYTYDVNNQLEKIYKNGQVQISYIYDQVGNVVKLTDSVGNNTAYTYDKASRMETVTFNGGKLTYQYDINGNRAALVYDSGVKAEYEYNKDNQVIKLINRKANGNIISKYNYSYDATGKQVTKTDSYGTTYYTYDKVGRILKVDGPGRITVYDYDNAGNRIAVNETYRSKQPSSFINEKTGSDVEYIIKKTDYTYSNANVLLKLVERMYDESNKEVLRKTVKYYYDGNGNELSNTTSWTHPHDVKLRQSTKGTLYAENMESVADPLVERVNNTFDGFGRLVRVEHISAGVRSDSEYVYNGDDLRVRKIVKKSTNAYNEEVTNFLYDRQHVILELDKDYQVKTAYVRGINYIASIDANKTSSYYIFNEHGDVVQTVSPDGEVLNSYEYDIWGNPTLTVETVKCDIRYGGEYYDSETGLYYLRARFYDPIVGRFISEDSYWGEDSNPLSLNRYTYAHNDPIQYLDPTGHYVLKKGSKGDKVVGLQERLKDLGYNVGKNIGTYTKQTKEAVEKFQKDYGLEVDGTVGNQTALAITKAHKYKEDIANLYYGSAVKHELIQEFQDYETGEITDASLLTPLETVQYYENQNKKHVSSTTDSRSQKSDTKNKKVVASESKKENSGAKVKTNVIKANKADKFPNKNNNYNPNCAIQVVGELPRIHERDKIDNIFVYIAKGTSELILTGLGEVVEFGTPIAETGMSIAYFFGKNIPEFCNDVSGYFSDIFAQVILGDKSKSTSLGDAINLATADLGGDLRILYGDIKNWDWSFEDIGQTAKDAMSIYRKVAPEIHTTEVIKNNLINKIDNESGSGSKFKDVLIWQITII